MVKIVLHSWREGLKKVSLDKLISQKLGFSLKIAKSFVDDLLDDKEVVIEVADENTAQEFVQEADLLGVNCFIKRED